MYNRRLSQLAFTLMLLGGVPLISSAVPQEDINPNPPKAMDPSSLQPDQIPPATAIEDPIPHETQASDSMPMPEPAKTGRADLMETAQQSGSFQTLTKALQAAGLMDTLKAPGPFTLFAPTDEAFAALPPKTLEDLMKPENKEKLIKVLTYHVVPGTVAAKDVADMKETRTLEGQPLKISHKQNDIRINNAKLLKTDIVANNGVIHAIDKVLIPN